MSPLAPLLTVAAFCVVTAAGCGTTGWIRYSELAPANVSAHGPTRSDVIECWDHESGELHTGAERAFPFRYRKSLLYVLTCTKDGHGIPGRVRRTAPAYSAEAEAIGAVCVDPSQPSMNNGPLRLFSYTNQPLRILRDDQPYPHDP